MATDDLIAALQGVGQVDSEGSFSFDREKAREKLRTFQVAEPQRYVLHLIALAALKQATEVTVYCDSDDLIVRFDGAPVTAEDLDDLYNSSFAAAHTDLQRARQQLAVGLHAALALNPRHVRLVSGVGEQAVSLLARHEQPDVVGPAKDATGGTQIHVKQRFRPGLMVRFVRHLRGTLAEAAWLRARACYATLPICLNGEVISAGLQLAGAEHCRSGALGEIRGVAGLLPDSDAEGVIRLVRHGVWICDEPRPWLPRGLVAVIASDRLLTDLSGDKVVHEVEHARCLELGERLAAEVVAAALGPEAAVDPPAALRERLRTVWTGWVGALDPATPIGAAMTRIVAWPDIWGERHSFAALLAEVARSGRLPVTAGDFAERVPRSAEVIVQRGELLGEVLAKVEAIKVIDYTAELERRALAEQNRRRWRAQPCEPTLTAANYVLVAPFEAQVGERRVTGQAGLRRAPGERCTLRVIVDGCALAELELDAPIAGVDAVICGPLAVARDFSGPVRDELFAAALGAWSTTARTLADIGLRRGNLGWKPGPSLQALLYGLLRASQPGEVIRAVLAAAGYEGRALAERELALLTSLPRAPVPKDMWEEPWLRDAFHFETAAGPRLSVGAIAVGLQQGLPLRFVHHECPPHPGIVAPVLRLGKRERELIRWLFGGQVKSMALAEYEYLRNEAGFHDRPVQLLTLPADSHGPAVFVDEHGLRVALAFVRTSEGWRDASHKAPCRILHASRRLTDTTIWSPVLGVSFVITGGGLTIKPGWDDVERDDAFNKMAMRAAAAVPTLVRAAIAAVEADPGHANPELDEASEPWRRAVLAALTASFPTPVLRAIYVHLLATRGRKPAEQQYLQLLALAAASSAELLSNSLAEHTTNLSVLMDTRQIAARVSAALPSEAQVEAVERVLLEIRGELGQFGGDSWDDHVGHFSPEVGALPLLRRVDGSPVTLAEAALAARQGGLHVHRVTSGRKQKAYLRAIAVDAQMQAQLGCLFGPARVRTDPPPEAVAAAEAAVKRPRSPSRPVVEPTLKVVWEEPIDPPPTTADLAAMFAELERESDAKAQRLPTRPAPVPEPEAEAGPAPTVARPPSPGERLIAAVQAELEALRRGHESLLTGFNLDHVRAVPGAGLRMISVGGDGLLVDPTHPLVLRAIERHADDRLYVSFLVSCVYTALNVWREDITDAHEAEFHARHLAWLHDEHERPRER